MNERTIPLNVAVQKIIQALIDRQPESISDDELRRNLRAEVSILEDGPLRRELERVIDQLQFKPH